MKKLLCFTAAFITLLFSCNINSYADNTKRKVIEPDVYEIADINGTVIEYAVYNNSYTDTVLLLPSNGSDMHSFDGDVLPYLVDIYKVITVSPRGTGKSGRGVGKLTFDLMCRDYIELLDYLNVEKVKIFGFSDGGNSGLIMALNYPDVVSRLAIMGANINTMGTKPFTQLGIFTEYHYLKIKSLITQNTDDSIKADIQGLMVRQPDLKFSDLNCIKIPVLNIYGQWDMIKRSHSKRITKSIPDCRELMIIGGEHSSCFQYTDSVIAPALLEFFSE